MKFFRRKDEDPIFTIQRATEKDIDSCVEMMAKAMVTQPIDSVVLEQTLKSPNIIVLIAKTKDKTVGMISGLALPSLIPPPTIDFLGVSDEESVRKGLYGILIDAFISEVKKSLPNTKYIDTNVPTVHSQIVAMYSVKGFVVIGFTKGEAPFSDIVALRKKFTENPSFRDQNLIS